MKKIYFILFMSKLECNKVYNDILAFFCFQFVTVPSSMIVHGHFVPGREFTVTARKFCHLMYLRHMFVHSSTTPCKKCTFCTFILFGSAFSIRDINWGKAFFCFRVLILSHFFNHSKFPAILHHVIVHRYSIFCCKFTKVTNECFHTVNLFHVRIHFP